MKNALPILLTLSFFFPAMVAAQYPIGIFEQHSEVGKVLHVGAVIVAEATQSYEISGSGENIWFNKDEFHYLWGQQDGDFILQTRGKLLGKGIDPHRKFGWMVRTSLQTDAQMVCATVHGDGLTAIQYRKKAGSNIEEVKSPVKMPDIIQLERRGRSFFLSVARFGEPFWTVEVPDFDFPSTLFAGLFVCSHNKDVVEKALFDNVRIIKPAKSDFVPYRNYIGSHIETMDVFTGIRRVEYSTPAVVQAPNWMPNGKSLIYNANGLIYRYNFETGKPELVNTDFVKQNNNDHVLSFDGKTLGLSSSGSEPNMGSRIYTVPSAGGKPTLITPLAPAYLHGWSPDGKWLTYTAQRNNDYDIYKIKSKGGKEIRLTDTPGLDDGSEYSPDGKYIYFNSERSGSMQIWRMTSDGKKQVQLTNDAYNNWFPHISPDGKWIVFLSFQPDIKADDHPFYKHVYLRMLPVEGGNPKVIAYLYGGQGSINTASWSADSRQIAFVSNDAQPMPWRYLMNGVDLSGWDTYLGQQFPSTGEDRTGMPLIGLNVDPDKNFNVESLDGMQVLHISGKQFGGISTVESFENYHLQLQFKWGKNKYHPKENAKMDSGVLYHADGPHGVDWGFWMQSQEFQVQEGDCGDYWGVAGAVFDIPASKQGEKDWIFDPKGALMTFADKTPAGRHCMRSIDAEYPSGEWNTLDLYCFGDAAVHVVNGKVVMVLYKSRRPVAGGGFEPLTKGKIQIQSEGAEIFYRNIRMQSITELPTHLLK